MLLVDRTRREFIESAYNLLPRGARWSLLSSGSVNSVFHVASSPAVIVRLALRRPASLVAQEVRLVRLLKAQSFQEVPQFLSTIDGHDAIETADRTATASVYSYIDGIVEQPLTDRHFACAVSALPAFLSCMAGVSCSEFPGRRMFPDAARAVGRAHALLQGATAWSDLENFATEALRAPLLQWRHDGVVHSDLHARNFVWRADQSLAAIIDFDRFCLADPLIEVAAFVTGTCFPADLLDQHRLEEVLDATRDYWQAWRPEEVVNSFLIVALYFFGRVNRHLLLGAGPIATETIEWRDAKRARAVLENRRSLERVVRSVHR